MTEDRMRLMAIALLRDHLGVEGEITDATTLDQVNADSLDRIEAGMALEEEFGLTIPDETIEKWRTVGDVLCWLASRSIRESHSSPWCHCASDIFKCHSDRF